MIMSSMLDMPLQFDIPVQQADQAERKIVREIVRHTPKAKFIHIIIQPKLPCTGSDGIVNHESVCPVEPPISVDRISCIQLECESENIPNRQTVKPVKQGNFILTNVVSFRKIQRYI